MFYGISSKMNVTYKYYIINLLSILAEVNSMFLIDIFLALIIPYADTDKNDN